MWSPIWWVVVILWTILNNTDIGGAECDPNSEYWCCSEHGFCGGTQVLTMFVEMVFDNVIELNVTSTEMVSCSAQSIGYFCQISKMAKVFWFMEPTRDTSIVTLVDQIMLNRYYIILN